jgi:stage III sporulation protein AB
VLKYTGLSLIFAVSILVGQEASAISRRQLRMTEALISLTAYIKGQIEFFSAPLVEIYGGFSNETLEKCGFITVLRKEGLSAALEEIRPSLPPDVYDSLAAFASGLGKSVKQSQLDLCEYHIEALRASYTEQKEALPKKTRLYTSLSVMAGLTAVIILL